MATLSMRGSGGAEQIAALLEREIPNSGLSCELVDSVRRSFGDSGLYIMVFDKYYMRNSSRASLTVAVSGAGGNVYVDAIGSGGGTDALFRFSLGAEENFVNTVRGILEPHGFR